MNTRLIAARVLCRVLQEGQSLTAALEAVLPTLDCSIKDKAFIQALCYGVCRYYHRLHFILSLLLDKPIKEPEIQALALLGLYQIQYMRVKTHAAVSETVKATRKKPWATALLNAVLRRYLREQEALEQAANQLPTAKFSHSDWLVQQIKQDWSELAESIFYENNQAPPMILRVNLNKISRDDYLHSLHNQEIQATAVDSCPSAIRLDNPIIVEALPKFAEGYVSVQDSAAQLAAGLLDLHIGQRVLDLCAAPGGKTAHILESQAQIKECVAVDIDAKRMHHVQENCQRLKLNPTLIVGDALKPDTWWMGQTFDRILVDAPCSALGVIRRHPDIKLLRRAEDIPVLQKLQHDILNSAWSMLAQGGMLLYATCSILKQENEQQIQQFLATHSDATELSIQADWGLAVSHGRQILTGMSGMDGFYYARLVKNQ